MIPLVTNVSVDLEILKLAAQHFRHNFRLFWEHSAFFALVNGALFSIYASNVLSMENPEFAVGASLAGVGIVLTVFWWWVVRGRVRLIARWREQVVRVDKAVDPHRIFVEIEKHVTQEPWNSPTYVAQFFPALIFVAWVAVAVVALV